ncbi:MAG: hypothetical protein QOF29_3789 [bacterium]|jgi:hypothetical protein
MHAPGSRCARGRRAAPAAGLVAAPAHHRRRRLAPSLLAALIAVGAAMLGASPALAAWDTSNQHQLVPAYAYPDAASTPSDWYRLCDAMNVSGGPSTAVINPASGPGAAVNPDYQRVIDYCHARGQRIVGYVHTSYGARPAADVIADIDAYYRFYPGIDGIFLDEMSNDAATAPYYRSLYDDIKARAGTRDVVGNPGTAASSAWQLDTPVADQVVVFEGTAADYLSWSPPSWVLGKAASQISNLVHSASGATDIGQVCAASKSRNAGYVYVTGDALPNPWDTLPVVAC